VRIVQFDATHVNKQKKDDGVCIEITNEPPKGLECPDFDQLRLDEEAFLIETDDSDPNEWGGCPVYWRGKYWKIELSLSIQNGEKALLTMTEQ
jgi:hypothetical protein